MKPILFPVTIKFVAVGLINTIIGLAAIYFFKRTAGMSDAPANFFGYSFGLTTSFVLNRYWTFRHSGAWIPAVALFLVTFGVAYLANLVVVLLLVHRFGINGYLAQTLGVPPFTVLFYLGSRYVAFR